MDDQTAREQALNAADRLFYARGIQSVGMDQLRAEAGISLKRLYSLFGSKEAIVEQVLRRRNQTWTDGIQAYAQTATTPRQKLLSIYDFLNDWFVADDYRGCAFINSFGELGASEPGIAEAARKHKESFQHYVAGVVEEAGGPTSLAAQLAILAEGAQTTAAIAGTPEAATQARAAAEVLIEAALRSDADRTR